MSASAGQRLRLHPVWVLLLLLLLLQGQGLLQVLLMLLLLPQQAWAYAMMCVRGHLSHGHLSHGGAPCSPCCGCRAHSCSARDPSGYELCTRTRHRRRRMGAGWGALVCLLGGRWSALRSR